MTDPRDPADLPVDASGEPLGEEQLLPPAQAPMDDAAGGPQADPSDIDEAATGDLSVQGGE